MLAEKASGSSMAALKHGFDKIKIHSNFFDLFIGFQIMDKLSKMF